MQCLQKQRNVKCYLGGSISTYSKQICSKQWEINKIDEYTTKKTASIPIQIVLDSWNRSELVIPPRFLDPGYYATIYTIRMISKDLSIEHKNIYNH